MKCSKCGCNNIIKASYCKDCNNKFTDKEKDIAYKKTFISKLENVETWYKRLTLSNITGNIIFKIASLIIILVIGIYTVITMGINTKILDSNDYQIFYNKNEKEYYLLVDNNLDEVNINLYKPNRLEELSIIHYNNENEVIDEINYENNKSIILNTYDNDYYVLKSKYKGNNTDDLKVIVYKEKDV